MLFSCKTSHTTLGGGPLTEEHRDTIKHENAGEEEDHESRESKKPAHNYNIN